MHMPILTYIKEISPRPIFFVHGEKAHSRYFSETAYAAAAEPKELVIVPGAVHVDLYDQKDKIPFDKLTAFFRQHLGRWGHESLQRTFPGRAMNSLHTSFDHARRRWHHVAGSCLVSVLLLGSTGHGLAADGQQPKVAARDSQAQKQMWMTVAGTQRFAVTLEDNPTARVFLQMLPMSLEMPDLNDNEKHVRLPRSLPTSATQPGTIRTGDLMLYGNDTLVVFYKTFPSSYSYTRIGRVLNWMGLLRHWGRAASASASRWTEGAGDSCRESHRQSAPGRPPEAMNGCFIDVEREGSGLVVWPLRSQPTGSYGSTAPIVC
jgi:hypothetical protein